MVSLMHLSNELKLIIISHLEAVSPPSTIITDAIAECDEEYHPRPLPSFPPHSTTPASLVALSQTCSLFRSLLAPSIFATLVLQNTPISGAAVSAIATSENARYAKEIRYIATVPLPDWSGKDREPSPSDFPSDVEHVLTNLSLFSELGTVSIHFPFQINSLRDNMQIGDDLESADEIRIAESRYGWRALMTSTYTALAKNLPGVVKSLVLQDVVPKESSTWGSEEWRALLGGLTKFEVNMRGWDNGVGWATGTIHAYCDFIENFDYYFFDHLSNITHLSISANEYGPAGTGGGYIGALCFNKKQMRLLQQVTLDYIFIGEAVGTLLQTHAETLQTVHLKHAYAIRELWHPDLSWAKFFMLLLDTSPCFPNVRSFVIDSTLPPYGDEGEADSAGESDLQFLYLDLDGKYGTINTWADEAEIKAQRPQREQDWGAYQRFMCSVVADHQETKLGT